MNSQKISPNRITLFQSYKKLYQMSTAQSEQFTTQQQSGRQILKRLDRLQFSRWHLFMVLSLGLVWIFDGYQVSLISLFRNYIVREQDQSTFKSLATSYQVGCILGSFIFGMSGFTIGRKKIFIITLIIYAFGILFSVISHSVVLFMLGRFLTGISIGGEFTAIFTAIDEFLPPKYRGRVNIGIDGTWHLGGSFAAILNMLLGEIDNWRHLFAIGIFGVLALLMMRRSIPESPRWLLLKKQYVEADLVVKSIEYAVTNKRVFLQPACNFISEHKEHIQNQLVSQRSEMDQQLTKQLDTTHQKLQQKQKQKQKSLSEIVRQILFTIVFTIRTFKSRFFLAFFLMFTQAFFFNLVYYKFPATLQNKYNLKQEDIGFYMLPLSLSSFLSTLIVGPLFDKIGRRQLLLVTYGCSGIILILSQYVESLNWLEVLICFMFFFTSPAGSSANLIASEIFPTSSRTLVLFIMFMIGMVGGIMGVWIDTVWIGSIFMICAGVLGYFLCPNSENKSLEEIEKM